MKSFFYNFILAIICFIVLGVILNVNFVENKFELKNWNKPVPSQYIIDKPRTDVFETTFDDLGFDTLVIPKVVGNSIKVYLNGNEIFALGTKTANIWSRVVCIKLNDLKPSDNELRIEIYGLYDIGLPVVPFLTDNISALKYADIKNFLREEFYLIAFGLSIVSGIISFIFGNLLKNNNINKAYVSFGIFLFLTSISLLDYQFRLFNFNEFVFLTMKKIFLLSAYFSSFFYIRGLEYYEKKELKSRWLIYYVLIISIFPLIAFNLNMYAKVSIIANMLFLPILIYIAFRTFYLRVEKLYFSTFFIIISYIHVITYFMFLNNFKFQEFLTGYATAALSGNLIIMLVGEFKSIAIESMKLSEKMLVDPLTKAYNRNILTRKKLNGYFVLIDLDNFKELNDKFGHEKGDIVLKIFSDIVRENIRKEDLFIRIGGDEFALIINSKNPLTIIEKIRKNVRSKTNLDFSYGITKFENFSMSYKKADKKLYKMKNEKKSLKL